MIKRMHRFWIAVVACVPLAAAETWNVKVEEPAAGTPSWLRAPLAKFKRVAEVRKAGGSSISENIFEFELD